MRNDAKMIASRRVWAEKRTAPWTEMLRWRDLLAGIMANLWALAAPVKGKSK